MTFFQTVVIKYYGSTGDVGFSILINISNACDWYWFPIWILSTYLQTVILIVGMWTKTMEKGPTSIGSDIFTDTGVREGIFPNESTVSISPFRSIIWLCISPFLAVKWYSSLVYSPFLDPVAIFVLEFRCPCCKVTVPWLVTFSVETTAWIVVWPSRLIKTKEIPFCISYMEHFSQK